MIGRPPSCIVRLPLWPTRRSVSTCVWWCFSHHNLFHSIDTQYTAVRSAIIKYVRTVLLWFVAMAGWRIGSNHSSSIRCPKTWHYYSMSNNLVLIKVFTFYNHHMLKEWRHGSPQQCILLNKMYSKFLHDHAFNIAKI